jgi:mannitol-specific phosphotransferase system IIBC component
MEVTPMTSGAARDSNVAPPCRSKRAKGGRHEHTHATIRDVFILHSTGAPRSGVLRSIPELKERTMKKLFALVVASVFAAGLSAPVVNAAQEKTEKKQDKKEDTREARKAKREDRREEKRKDKKKKKDKREDKKEKKEDKKEEKKSGVQ